MEIRAYDEAYLASAQNILGHAADFAIMTLNQDPDDFHEMDVTHFTDHMNRIMRKSYPVSRLNVHRMNNSMSPEDLGEASGIELSEILLLEEKEKDINSIAAIDLLRLSKALHCGMEDLIEL